MKHYEYVIAKAASTLQRIRVPVITSDAEDVASSGASLSESEVGLFSLSLPVGLGSPLPGAAVGSLTPLAVGGSPLFAGVGSFTSLAVVGSLCDTSVGSVTSLVVGGSPLVAGGGSFTSLADVGSSLIAGVGAFASLAVVGSPLVSDVGSLAPPPSLGPSPGNDVDIGTTDVGALLVLESASFPSVELSLSRVVGDTVGFPSSKPGSTEDVGTSVSVDSSTESLSLPFADSSP
jgi:hypothetical protein